MGTYKQPVGQKRLTNIALVRLKKHGLRFEVACYKNKVMSWRAGVERDIDEVLQTHTIFANVGKGTLAKSADLIRAFGTDDEDIVCREILAHGEYQVSDKEREVVAGSLQREVLLQVAERTVNPDTLRPHSVGMIEKFANQLHFAADPSHGAKQQALELIRLLVQHFPVARARMELRVGVPAGSTVERELLGDREGAGQLADWGGQLSSRTLDSASGLVSVVFQVDPGKFRQCDAWARTRGARLEVLATAVHADADISFDMLEGGSVQPRAGPPVGAPPGEKVQVLPVGQNRLASEASTQMVGRGDAAAGAAESTPGAPVPPRASPGVLDVKCTTCGCGVESRVAYREHCKSEWHKHNMRRRARQMAPLGPNEWETDAEMLLLENKGLDEF